ARFFARAADFRTAFSPDLLFWAHPDYPWLLPGAVAQGYALIGREAAIVPEALAALYGALVVAVVIAGMARLRGLRCGLLAGLAVVTFPVFATFASNQQADVPLAVYFAAAIALVALADERADHPAGPLVLAGFCAGLGLWTKNEGALYAACIAAAIAVRRHDVRAVALFCLGALPCVALLALFKLKFAPANDLARFSTPATLLAHALDPARWWEMTYQTLRRVVFFQSFGLWLIGEALALALWVRKSRASVAGTAVFLATAAYLPIYILQPHSLQWIFRTSIDRILMQLWPAAVLATVLAIVPGPATART
ncbi:MAG: glycosyltransferase family 39 protein, partial [Myxococcales bacterium]|nr:glycosyltransferase family 39 protein [Myxococcales bacterium]